MFGCEEPGESGEAASGVSAGTCSQAASHRVAVIVRIAIPVLRITESLSTVVMPGAQLGMARQYSKLA